MTAPLLGRAFAIVCTAFAAGCASLPPPPAAEAPVSAVDQPFSIGGRISARRGDAGVAGSFTWTHDAQRDAIDLASPLGQTLAQLEGDGRKVTVHLSDGRVETAPTWAALTERAFGVTIPVDGLAWWIRGLPRAGIRYGIERDASGRVSLLRQEGWEVVYTYSDAAAREPLRIALQYPGTAPIEVRVVVDRRGP
ncbi:MAG TPA: lipoprotein insertase outer membrane protein LolB [Casimicrobiaceae bacterium]